MLSTKKQVSRTMPECVLLYGPQGMRWTITARQLARFVAAKVESCARTAQCQVRARLRAQFRYISSLRIVTLPSRLSCHQAHQPEPNSIPSSRAASMRQTRNFSSKLSCMRTAPLPIIMRCHHHPLRRHVLMATMTAPRTPPVRLQAPARTAALALSVMRRRTRA